MQKKESANILVINWYLYIETIIILHCTGLAGNPPGGWGGVDSQHRPQLQHSLLLLRLLILVGVDVTVLVIWQPRFVDVAVVPDASDVRVRRNILKCFNISVLVQKLSCR
jgi:hypothetical protein